MTPSNPSTIAEALAGQAATRQMAQEAARHARNNAQGITGGLTHNPDTPQSSQNSQMPSIIPGTQNVDPRPNRPNPNPIHGHQTPDERAQEIHDLNRRLLLAQIDEAEAKAAATRAATAQKSSAIAVDNNQGKNDPPIVKTTLAAHPGIAAELIRKIYDNSFAPTMLPKLRTGRGADAFQESTVQIEGGELKTGPVPGRLKDFGNDSYIWSDAFENYMSIYSQIHCPKFPTLQAAMFLFHKQIITLSQTFKWQGAVLDLAIEYHTTILENGPTDADLWREIPSWIIMRLCPYEKQLGYTPPTTRPQTNKRNSSTQGEIDRDEVCNNFNRPLGCKWGSNKCYRKHECTKCGSKDHGETTYPK